MNYSKLYDEKLITVDTALEQVQSDFEIVCALGPCEPKGFLSKLHTIKDRVENVNVVTMLSLNEYKYNTCEEMKGHFYNESLFMGAPARKARSKGLGSYIPTHLRYSAVKRLKYKKPNIFIGSATKMDKHGFFSLALSLVYEKEDIEAADIVILEVNDKLPKVHGDTAIHISEVDYIIENSHDVDEIKIVEPSEKDLIIGNYIKDLVDDGSTIQLGIGGIPNAVAKSLECKKDLGIHTEMITEGIVDLFEKGVITNKKKTLHKGKIVGTFALGTKKLYDFLDDNPCIELKPCSYVNNPFVIAKNDNMISINTALAVDLTGQCSSESFGFNQYSGTGGQADTGIGAGFSVNGKSIIALHSTAKNDTISTITAGHLPGTTISYSRNDVDYVVTEYGVARLMGKSVRERAQALIEIAHPDFRDELRTIALENNLY